MQKRYDWPMKDKPMENEVDVSAVLALAALIRKVDGKHSLGAAALAEALLGHPDFLKVVAPPLLSERIDSGSPHKI
jgi:hypothetical protein